MSGKKKGRDQAPSTVEAIQMASVSVLSTTTRKGIPLGSAIGSGSMMEENSEVVAMNVAPLVLAIRDTLLNQEGLDLLSLEWDLEFTPGPRVLPEQLTIAGGTSSGVGSYVCVLSWENGVIDPFKIDAHMKQLSKKIADIDTAVSNNELDYENEGLRVLRRFNDRLNSVVFVEMMDRRFQGSWDSFQLKPENVDIESVVKVEFRDDFTIRPPGIRVLRRMKTEFMMPQADEAHLVEHFKHRVLTPAAVEALTVSIPETGRAILSELNAFAYSKEEALAAKAVIESFSKSVGKTEISHAEMDSTIQSIGEFIVDLQETVAIFEEVIEGHISSGKTLTLAGHEREIELLVQTHKSDLSDIRADIIRGFVERMMQSVESEFPVDDEVRAWQLKSTMRYFLAYSKRVRQYFESEFIQYLMVSVARELLVSALQGFRQEMIKPDMDPIDRTLFEKIYQELFAQLNAAFDKKAFEGARIDNFADLTTSISNDLIEVFKKLDIWDLVDFADIAEIARAELKRTHSPDTGLDNSSVLMEMLLDFETLVSEIAPDIAQTLLAKDFLDKVLTWATDTGKGLEDELIAAVRALTEKPEAWLNEAVSWIEEFRSTSDSRPTLPNNLLEFLRFIHERIGRASGARSVVDKVVDETEQREVVYDQQVKEWKSVSKQIEAENETIRAHNERRETLIIQAKQQFIKEREDYELRLAKMREQPVSLAGEDQLPVPTAQKPNPPVPLESHLQRIDTEYPSKDLKPLPECPEPSEELLVYQELRSLLTEKLEQMTNRQGEMERVFGERLEGLTSPGAEVTDAVRVGIVEPFHEYLMDSTIRGLGHLFPRTKRAYLRDPERPNLLYLVTYEHDGSELTVTIGDTYLRGD